MDVKWVAVMSARMAIGQESGVGAAVAARIAETCESCPLHRAAFTRENQGAEAEAHVLRILSSELSHKLALTRGELRRRGFDPDLAYIPHDQVRG